LVLFNSTFFQEDRAVTKQKFLSFWYSDIASFRFVEEQASKSKLAHIHEVFGEVCHASSFNSAIYPDLLRDEAKATEGMFKAEVDLAVFIEHLIGKFTGVIPIKLFAFNSISSSM
jgi:hypothetical protein